MHGDRRGSSCCSLADLVVGRERLQSCRFPVQEGVRNHGSYLQVLPVDGPSRPAASLVVLPAESFLYRHRVIHSLSMKDPAEDEMDFVPDEELGDVASAGAKLKKLKDELIQVKGERQEYLDGWQRCKADSVNSRKETLAHAERLGERAKEGLVEDIIPALDGFDMAAGSPAWESLDAGWRSGIEQIRSQLLDVLSRH